MFSCADAGVCFALFSFVIRLFFPWLTRPFESCKTFRLVLKKLISCVIKFKDYVGHLGGEGHLTIFIFVDENGRVRAVDHSQCKPVLSVNNCKVVIERGGMFTAFFVSSALLPVSCIVFSKVSQPTKIFHCSRRTPQFELLFVYCLVYLLCTFIIAVFFIVVFIDRSVYF